MVKYYIDDPAALQRPVNARRTSGLLLLGITILCIPLAVQHYSSGGNHGEEMSEMISSSNAALHPEANFQPLLAHSLHNPTAELYRKGRQLLESVNSDELSVVVTFEDILKTIVFLLCAWLFALVFRVVGLPALVGEIVCGFVLGPPVLNFCPYPEAMVLIGNFGLIGLILDSGVNLDIAQLKETGSRAVILAVCGTVLAMSTGFGMGSQSKDNFQSALAIGAAFAPSSLGVASQVLAAGEVLNTPTGQLIVAASVVDDVLGLIMLSILEVFVLDTPEVIDFLLPFISSFGFLIVLGYLGITWIPRILQKQILPRFHEEKREAISFALMFFMLTAYLPLLNYSGASYLTGAFLTGLSFSQIHFVHVAYTRSTKEVMVWLMRIFFAATIGFQVPVRYFANPEVLKLAAGFCKFVLLIFTLFALTTGCVTLLYAILSSWAHQVLFDQQCFLFSLSYHLVCVYLVFSATYRKAFRTIHIGEMFRLHPCQCFVVANSTSLSPPLDSVLACSTPSTTLQLCWLF